MVSGRFKKHDIAIAAVMFLLFFFICILQTQIESNVSAKSDSMNYLPSGIFLKGMALGYDEALADFLWVRLVGYFGAHVKTDQDYTWLKHMLNLAIELDPLYESPYEFAGIILPAHLDDVDGAIGFLEKGIRNISKKNPRYWLQPFYLGYCYMIYKNNPLKAAHYFKIAATFPKSPAFLPLLISRLYASADRPEIGLQLLQSLLNDPENVITRNEYMRDALRKRLKELTVNQHILVLEKAVAEYTRRYGKRPSQLEDLITSGLISKLPIEPFGGSYYLTENGTEVHSTVSEGKMRLHPTP